MRLSWQRVEQQQRKEAPLETVICMLIWPQVSLLSGTMRHSCVETRLHRNSHITLPLQQPTTWDLSSPSISFLEPDTVDGGELEMALGTCDEPWEDQSWEEPEETEFRMMTGQMNSHQTTQNWKINLALWRKQRPTL